jgi:hypothetical protein
MSSEKFRPNKIKDIALNNKDILANLYQHSLVILTLQNAIRQGIDPALAPHVHVASLDTKTITVYADNQGWATKLRFQTAEVLKIARNTCGYSQLESLRIRVSPALINPSSPVHPAIAISDSTSRLLAKVADNIGDTALQAALKKLSNNNR